MPKNVHRPGGAAGDAAGARRPCPICGRPAEERWRPFCSRRCADVDLARWLGGRYAIPGEPVGDARAGRSESDDGAED